MQRPVASPALAHRVHRRTSLGTKKSVPKGTGFFVFSFKFLAQFKGVAISISTRVFETIFVRK